jgi:hypothetical protein
MRWKQTSPNKLTESILHYIILVLVSFFASSICCFIAVLLTDFINRFAGWYGVIIRCINIRNLLQDFNQE